MSQLRDTLIKAQKEQTLKELLQEKYEETPLEQKEHFLSFLGDTIERDVDKMIREEIDAFNENTPIKRKNKKLTIFQIIANVILTILIGFTVNEEQWFYVAGLGLLMALVLILPLIYED
jgi:fatty-acid desaturase